MTTYRNYKLTEDSTGKKAHFKNKNLKNKNLAVFVHGFTGDYLSTWGKFPQFLTNDPRLSHYDFLFWGYSSNLLTSKDNFISDNIKQLFIQLLNKHKTNQHIDVVAQSLQTELKYIEDYENITLIGHSLGGLIIRSYIIQNLIERKKENLDRINKINQIILFGTPNEGIDMANNKLLSSFNNQIYDVGSYNEFINTLREEWIELVFKDKNLGFTTLMVAGEDDYFVPFKQVTKYFRDSREVTQGDHTTMVKPKSVNDLSYKIVANNLLKVSQNKNSPEEGHSIPRQIYPSSEYLKTELDKIRKLIASRGLDDEDWSCAVSSQYFLVRLARLLKITDTSEYLNLLDLFLKSFYMRVDNSIILSEDKILITPVEARRMKQFMIEEDKRDDYFTRYSKTTANNLDTELLQDNYHYGLVAQISRAREFPDSSTLRLIQGLAMQRLLYRNEKKPIDDHGGWYPQRLPWLTARILISLKNSDYEVRSDKEYIEKTASKAIDYLIRSIYQDKYWRSGAGEWVSDLESTALCLEAIDEWGKIKEYEHKILPIIKHFLALENEWLEHPSFDSEEESNATLASVTLLCNILIIIHNNFKEEIAIDYKKYLDYLASVFDYMVKSSALVVRQYNTMPQITFYITRFVLALDSSLVR